MMPIYGIDMAEIQIFHKKEREKKYQINVIQDNILPILK